MPLSLEKKSNQLIEIIIIREINEESNLREMIDIFIRYLAMCDGIHLNDDT